MTEVAEAARTGLRTFLLTGRGSLEATAAELARHHERRAGVGISVFSEGKQLTCRVSLRSPTGASMNDLLGLVRSELPPGRTRGVVLLSLLDTPRTVSIDEYSAHGIRLGEDSVAAVRGGRATVILAHVPCFMSWSSDQLGEALVRKQGGARPLELHVFPTETIWLRERGRRSACRGGLCERRARLGSADGLWTEIALVAAYLRGQLSAAGAINYAYDAWRDRAIELNSPARKAIALGVLVGAGRFLGDDSLLTAARDALARLAAARVPAGDIHDAHLLLASPEGSDPARVDLLRAAVRGSGAIVGPDPSDQEFFPGAALTALAARGAVSEAECARSLHHYRQQFRARPAWPALWWQLRAWSTVATAVPPMGRDFAYELADWALERQLASGAFGITPRLAQIQAVCVAEALLAAARAAHVHGSPGRARRYVAAARRALRCSSSLVVDARHADLLPRGTRAIGGVRTLHSELVLRADVAGHYLAALLGLADLTKRG